MADNDEGKPGDGGDGSGTGMDRVAMKKMLALSRRTPLNTAIGLGDAKSGGLGLLLMDRVMPPKQVLKTLREQFLEPPHAGSPLSIDLHQGKYKRDQPAYEAVALKIPGK